ncbi:SAM-dependent methyltransferase [Hoeflea prorocentri]|uniref:Cyclopropane-fatty-acyl-phospholipid synthase n=1 Tax=Hoeflea prorocentri TaxID=1922333 RepID=A0A9X3UM88_9HYPH|nr:cyclopropane-fatty-acyl-phospholipid synthase family protein [Hoeflea prorocentri]MCY6383227.1 cyclopropane-fatty-acyl-phospholipid synthase [Hoeflea prorocentri]MDA5401027.1 cyclopropane-fatty-acyl-phospholipid synthase [Hoeflea prorocentri]
MGAKGRLKSLGRLLGHARDVMQIDVGFILWDGSTVPEDLADDAFAVKLADEGVVSSLMRKPRMETLLNLWVSKRIDLVNGSIFDLTAQKPKVRTREIRSKLSKWTAFNALRKFLFVGRGGPWPLEDQSDDKTSDGSREENEKNIQYHYDVSNAFYALWLDEEMVYTCGYCTDWDNDLDRMQRDKLEMICRKLRLKPGETMLDIGSGWGALCIYAAQNYGVSTLGVTLSEEQIEYAKAKAERLGLSDRVKFELIDYAAVQGQFDKVVSVGMQEHIGLENHPTYYGTVKRVLKPEGLFLNHAITRQARRDDKAFRKRNEETKLITKYIFPGGELDHIGNTLVNMERAGFEVHDVEDWREHYQRTCRHWHDRLLANYDAAVAEVGEVKTRMWLLYLGGCSITFERNGMKIYQTLISHKRRGPSGLPPTRADLYQDD